MRKLLLAGAAGAALFTAGLAAPSAANAMPLAPLASGPNLVDNVTYYGCGWNRFCGWRPGPYYYYGAYGYGRPYWGYRWGYRPWAYRWGYRRYW